MTESRRNDTTQDLFRVPLLLAPNPVQRSFYGAGPLIERFRSTYDNAPAAEDWLSSDIQPRSTDSDSEVGLGHVFASQPERQLQLRHLAAVNPTETLGSPNAQAQRYLAKLLCPDRRIPIHCHPDGSFAREYLGSTSGKTEAWIVLSDSGNDMSPNAWIGIRQELSSHDWFDLIRRQDSQALLSQLNSFTLRVGDVAFVPAGTPHALGPNLLVFEPQEPSDWSILAEHTPFSVTEAQATLGLGWKVARACFNLTQVTSEQAEEVFIRRNALNSAPDGLTPILAEETADYFSLAVIRTQHSVETNQGDCWTGVVVEGSGSISSRHGGLTCSRGATFFVPAAANPVTLESAGGRFTVLGLTSDSASSAWTRTIN